jgi:N4-gp56 family major capsid protein
MANAYTATADVTGFIPNYYSKVFLERLQPGPKMMEFVTKKPLPLNAGKVAYFPRLAVDSTVISAYTLSEGTIRDTDKIDDAQVSCTIQQFGRSAAITDLTEMTAINGTIEEAVRGLGDQANNIIDRRIMEEAYGTSATGDVNAPAHLGLSSIAFNTVAGAEGGAMSAYGVYTGTTEFRMKASTVRNGVSWLLAKNVKPFDDGFFALVVRSNTAMRLQADSEWQTAYQYTDAENLRKGVAGTYAGAKVVIDNNIATSANGSAGATLYFSLLLGRGCIGATELDGGIQHYTTASGASKADPLNQFITIGWKANFTAKLLNKSCGVILVTAD